MDRDDEFQLQQNLNRFMNERGLTTSHLARRLKMNKSTLHNYCNGVLPQSIQTLKKLADFFEVSLTELLFGPNERRTETADDFEQRFEILIRPVHRQKKKDL